MKTKKSPTVYILKCADNSYYTGVTNNINRRISEHQQGINPSCYTFDKRPLTLVYVEFFQTFEEAFKREKQIKKWSRAKKEALISGNWEKLIELSKSHGSTSSP